MEASLNADKWTAALRSIAVAAGVDIELREVRTLHNLDNPRPDALQIDGHSTGAVPRATADRFRHALGRELRKYFPDADPSRFERLEDEPEIPSSDPTQRRATFTIIAPLGTAVPAVRQRKEKG